MDDYKEVGITIRFPKSVMDQINAKLKEQKDTLHISKNSFVVALIQAGLDSHTRVGPIRES